ncbi:protein YIF1B [Topomyia yanbarensis]|uniref:protein YIF1B n=1 Tax=Topomyia yanbarensis TaxID=2498891 RepID=UPI00273AA857|nr:protein YIF1B [Topomyia yanbarensis]
MNYNASSGTRNSSRGGPKKPKRVSDINAMGAPTAMPTPQFAMFEQTTQPLLTNPGVTPLTTGDNQYMSNAAYDFSHYSNYTNTQQQLNVPQHPQNQPGQNQQGTTAINPGMPTQFSVFQQPIVQDMALQYGQKLADQGKDLVNTQFEKYIPVTKLKYYFAVDNKYVISKLKLIFFPFSQRDWSLKYDHDNPVQPRYDINAPDLYIPTMAYITYVVLAGMVLGFQNRFSPEQLGIQASSALAYSIFELVIYILTLYLANISTSITTLDLLSLSGYKYASIVSILLCSIFLRKPGYYISLVYASTSLTFFLLRTLKAKVMSEPTQSNEPPTYDPYRQQQQFEHNVGRKRKLYFLFLVSGLQPVLAFWLSMHLIPNDVTNASATRV